MTDMSGTHMSPVATGQGPASQSPFEANLSGAFADHPREGAWASEVGDNAYGWELGTMESHSEGDTRHTVPTHSPDWNTTTIVGTPTTGAEPGALYQSEFPNH